jgi:hypothetical protein
MSSFSSPAAALGNTADGRQHCYGGENTASSNGRSTDGTADAANNKVEDDNVEGGANGGIAGDDSSSRQDSQRLVPTHVMLCQLVPSFACGSCRPSASVMSAGFQAKIWGS